MKVNVDQKKCIGCGACAAVCPDVFEMADTKDGQKSKVKKADVTEDCAKQAESSCPVNAITVK